MNTLSSICDDKREHVRKQKIQYPQRDLEQKLKTMPATRGFARALQAAVTQGKYGLIAEVKKASPSKGVIREDFAPVAIAKAYVEGGATCISVLTDTPYFQGDDVYLARVRAAVDVPLLRKDFMLDPYQMYESRVLGADCILLIMAALSDDQAQELESLAFALGMDVLIEVHDEAEMERALAHLKSPLMGINNRNLKTLMVDITTSQRLSAHLPAGKIGVCESGIASIDDLMLMKKHGISCFLVGESLMREADVAAATKRLLGNMSL